MVITKITQLIEYLASRFSLLYYLSMLYYRGMVRREVELAHITEDDHVLVVGGGPCPHTAILIHKLTGATVTVVDNDFLCVKASIRLIDRLGLWGKVRVLHRNGQNLSTEHYSVIVLALQLSPKVEIIRSMERQAKPGDRILIRLAKDCLADLYSPVNQSQFSSLPTVEHSQFTNVEQTVLYQVKVKSNEKETDKNNRYSSPAYPAHALVG